MLLPNQAEQVVRDFEARMREVKSGGDPYRPVGSEPGPGQVPFRTNGHGSEARRRKHIRDGEKPCRSCADALDRARYPQGRPVVYGSDLMFGTGI